PPPQPVRAPTASARTAAVGTIFRIFMVISFDRAVLRGKELALDRAGGHALDEVSLEGDEENEDGDEREERTDDQQVVVVAVRRQQRVQTDGKDELVGAAEHQQRPQEVVPAHHAVEDRHGRDRGLRDRQHEAEEDSELGDAINTTSLDELVRHAQEVLTEEEDRHGVSDERQEDDEERIGHTEVVHLHVQRQHDHFERHRHDDEHRNEDDLFAAELVHG